MSLSVGLKSRSGFKAETDGECIAKLRTSGAIVLLISNTPELAFSWETFNNITGYTNNPYDTTCTAGGSSGGEVSIALHLKKKQKVIWLGSPFRVGCLANWCWFRYSRIYKIACDVQWSVWA